MSIKEAKKLIELTHQKKALQATLKDIEAAIESTHEKIITFLVENELKNLKFDDATVYVARSQYARPKTDEDRKKIAELLRGTEWEDVCGYNAQSLSSRVNEAISEGQPLPAGLEDLVDICTRTQVRVTK